MQARLFGEKIFDAGYFSRIPLGISEIAPQFIG
jgi:hypothetical protein